MQPEERREGGSVFTGRSKIYESNVHNPRKWEGADNPNSYTNQAITAGNEYFDLGASWDTIKAQYESTDGNMFDLFKPFLDDIIQEAKTTRFTHNPDGDVGALGDELTYLKRHGYIFDPESLTAKKVR